MVMTSLNRLVVSGGGRHGEEREGKGSDGELK
jgi:hypothetical protein